MKKILSAFLFLLIFQLAVNAQKDSLFKPKFYLYMGSYSPDVSTSLRLDATNSRLGSTLSLEDNLNFDAHPNLFRIDALLKVSKRSSFSLGFLSMKRSSTSTLDKTIYVMDTSFNVGASINIRYDTYYWALTYRYAIFNKPTWNAGVSTGFRVLRMSLGYATTFNRQDDYSAEGAVSVPMALVGIYGSAYLTKKLQGRYSFEAMGFTLYGLKVNVLDNNLALEYYIIKNLGLGISYSQVSYIANDIPFSEKLSGAFKYSYSGFSFFLAARF